MHTAKNMEDYVVRNFPESAKDLLHNLKVQLGSRVFDGVKQQSIRVELQEQLESFGVFKYPFKTDHGNSIFCLR